MADRLFFQDIPPNAQIRQGDIIRTRSTSDKPSWGVILTADCDIAQEKMGDHFTCAPIILASDYVAHYWAAIELDKMSGRLLTRLSNNIYEIDKRRDPAVRHLAPCDIIAWLKSEGTTGIEAALSATATPKQKHALRIDLSVLKLLAEPSSNPLKKLVAAWDAGGKKTEEQSTLLEAALRQNQMRAEFVLIPTLPREREVGFIVRLRDVRSTHKSDIFLSELDARIDGKTDAFYRIGRFSDSIRYGLAQRLAFLFSRIGMTESFEQECEQAALLALTTLRPQAFASSEKDQ